jgi:hypothetical protein
MFQVSQLPEVASVAEPGYAEVGIGTSAPLEILLDTAPIGKLNRLTRRGLAKAKDQRIAGRLPQGYLGDA